MTGQPSGRREEILEAAAEVFAERGYPGGSMRRIADKVGVTEPALYRHFDSKEAIFIALMRLAAGRIVGETTALIDGLQAPVLRTQMLEFMSGRRAAMARYAPVLRTVLSAMTHNPRFLEEYRALIVLPMKEHLTRKAAALDAEFGVPDADGTRDGRVRALMALLVGYFATTFVLGDEPDQEIADAALRVMGWERYA